MPPQLQTMLESPFQHKAEDPRGKPTSCYPELIDEDHRFLTGLHRVEMRWRMIIVVDIKGDPEKL